MFTKKDLAECCQRELTKRRENYPKWVRERRMTQSVADEQINMMMIISRVIMRVDDKLIAEAQG